VLIIAFQEKVREGLLCLLVPCYAFYYIVSRWEETKGAFCLELLPVGNLILLFGIGFALNAAVGPSGAGARAAGADPAAFAADADMVAGNPSAPPADLAPRPPQFGPRPPALGPRPPAIGPRRGMPDAAGRRFVPGADTQSRIKDFVLKHGGRSVVLVFQGIPTNTDPTRGVTEREVSEAAFQRARDLAPNAQNFFRTQRENRYVLAISPVDDVAAFARKIDFGTCTILDNVITVVLSPEFIESVPRT
jgi:hypothetical protein